MATDEQGRQLSEDGYYYWDGSAWQPVQQAAASSGDASSSSQASEEEIRAVGDSGPEPAQNVPDHLQHLFQDGDPAGGAGNEVAAVLDEDQFTGPAA
jgi:hypothetical protein